MIGKNKFSTEENKSKKLSIRYFWLYAAILFGSALILSMIASYIQNNSYKQFMLENKQINEEIGVKTSVLQDVQATNDSLTKEIENTNKLLKAEKENTKELTESNEKLTKINEQMKTILTAENFYIKGYIKSARAALEKLKKEDVLEELLPMYNTIKSKI